MLDSKQIGKELERVLRKYRAGMISESQAKLEQSLLSNMLKAFEVTELQEKIDRLEAILEGRR